MIHIRKLESEDDIEIARELILEYGRIRNFDAAMGDYEKELAGLPGEYSLPHGCLLLAFYDDDPVGCVALRKIDDDFCEMKRLFVKEKYRGKKIGKALVLELISEACQIGYKFMRLDNHPWMIEAEFIYKSVGFKEIEAYRFNPTKGVKFFELDLEKHMAI
ncbi:MAG: GNAT family N-acetyltransferase [Thermoplasmata archaeon]|nr:MAG: GNAT family N-acetyltransferase [Thermoplasmata archaeon]